MYLSMYGANAGAGRRIRYSDCGLATLPSYAATLARRTTLTCRASGRVIVAETVDEVADSLPEAETEEPEGTEEPEESPSLTELLA
jgi:hypothetical protein